MAGTNNFVPFNANKLNMMNDANYLASNWRLNGNQAGIAPVDVYNKLFYQTSVFTAAYTQAMADLGYNVSDSSLATLTTALKNNMCFISPTYIVWGSGLVFMECESSTVVSTSGAIATFNLTYPLTVSATGNGSIYPVASGAPCPVSLAVGARSATGITITAQRADGSAIVSGQLLIQAFCVNFLAGSSLLG